MKNNNFKYKISDYLKDDSVKEKKEVDLMKVVREGKPNVSVDRSLLLQRTDELSDAYDDQASQIKKFELMKEIINEIHSELVSNKTEDEYRKIYATLCRAEVMLNKNKNNVDEEEIKIMDEKIKEEKRNCVNLIFEAKCQDWDEKHKLRK